MRVERCGFRIELVSHRRLMILLDNYRIFAARGNAIMVVVKMIVEWKNKEMIKIGVLK